LDPCDLDAFVGFDMRPQTNTVLIRDFAHALRIAADAFDLEDK
jgi:hypothetical protein